MAGDNVILILRRLIESGQADVSPAAAEAILKIQFSELDQSRIAELAAKSEQGALAAGEGEEYDGYIAVADLLSLWKSKARQALRKHPSAA